MDLHETKALLKAYLTQELKEFYKLEDEQFASIFESGAPFGVLPSVGAAINYAFAEDPESEEGWRSHGVRLETVY